MASAVEPACVSARNYSRSSPKVSHDPGPCGGELCHRSPEVCQASLGSSSVCGNPIEVGERRSGMDDTRTPRPSSRACELLRMSVLLRSFLPSMPECLRCLNVVRSAAVGLVEPLNFSAPRVIRYGISRRPSPAITIGAHHVRDMVKSSSFAVILIIGLGHGASANAAQCGSATLDRLAPRRDTRTMVVAPLREPSLLVQNLRLAAAPANEFRPSALLKFDVLNHSALWLTDVVMRVSFVEKRLDESDIEPARVIVGPVTVQVDETLQAGYTLSYEMLFRNLSPDCECSPRVEIISARLLIHEP
jgi:hypothetical protein